MAEIEDLKQILGQQHQVGDHEKQEENNGDVKEAMKPWEHHSAVISIPRFDYNAPSSILQHSHTGFLITCPIKRRVLQRKQYPSSESGTDCLGGSDSCKNVKRRKLDQAEEDSAITIKSELSKDESQSVGLTDNSVKQTPNIVLVKVTRSGLLLFTYPKGQSFDPVSIVSDINQSLESGVLKRPLWCHRIFPIQATCRLNEKEVSSTVLNLVLKYVDDKSKSSSRPLKFAVGYNRRGIEETEIKTMKDDNNNSLLDRNKCFSIVAAAVHDAVSDSTVDLKAPDLCILIELLPVSGMPNGSLITAISVLSRDLVSTKPRLCIKALVNDPKAKKEVY